MRPIYPNESLKDPLEPVRLKRKYGSVEAGFAAVGAKVALQAEEAREAELATLRRRLEAMEAQLAAKDSTNGTSEVPDNGASTAAVEIAASTSEVEIDVAATPDERTGAILRAYLDAGESSVKAAELLAETEHAVSDRTIRTIIGQHRERLEELRAA